MTVILSRGGDELMIFLLFSSWDSNIPGELGEYHACRCPGGRLNKKDGLTRYGDSHVKDKTS